MSHTNTEQQQNHTDGTIEYLPQPVYGQERAFQTEEGHARFAPPSEIVPPVQAREVHSASQQGKQYKAYPVLLEIWSLTSLDAGQHPHNLEMEVMFTYQLILVLVREVKGFLEHSIQKYHSKREQSVRRTLVHLYQYNL